MGHLKMAGKNILSKAKIERLFLVDEEGECVRELFQKEGMVFLEFFAEEKFSRTQSE